MKKLLGRLGGASSSRVESPLENPNVVDVISRDPFSEAWVLWLKETRPWTGSDEQVEQLRQKIARYVDFAVGGEMDVTCPDSVGHPKRIHIHGTGEPDAYTVAVIVALRDALTRKYGITLSVHDPTEPDPFKALELP